MKWVQTPWRVLQEQTAPRRRRLYAAGKDEKGEVYAGIDDLFECEAKD